MSILEKKPLKGTYLYFLIIMCAALFIGGQVFAQALIGPEYQVKAGFIYNFAKFVEWPKSAFDNDANLLILFIAPNTPESNVFFSLNNKKVGNKKIEVKKGKNVDNIKNYHILFLDSKDKKFIQKNLNSVKDQAVLTVGHDKNFLREGGIINFFTEKGGMRFGVNLEAAKRSKLKLGSQILMSAEIISTGK